MTGQALQKPSLSQHPCSGLATQQPASAAGLGLRATTRMPPQTLILKGYHPSISAETAMEIARNATPVSRSLTSRGL